MQSVARTLLASKDIDLVYGHHAHVVQPLQNIDGTWVVYGLGNNVASHETPIEATREGLLVRVTFSQDDAGGWTTSDVAWVPSLQGADPPHRWCSLTAGSTCTPPDVDAAALARTTAAVNLYGANADGARLLDDYSPSSIMLRVSFVTWNLSRVPWPTVTRARYAPARSRQRRKLDKSPVSVLPDVTRRANV